MVVQIMDIEEAWATLRAPQIASPEAPPAPPTTEPAPKTAPPPQPGKPVTDPFPAPDKYPAPPTPFEPGRDLPTCRKRLPVSPSSVG